MKWAVLFFVTVAVGLLIQLWRMPQTNGEERESAAFVLLLAIVALAIACVLAFCWALYHLVVG